MCKAIQKKKKKQFCQGTEEEGRIGETSKRCVSVCTESVVVFSLFVNFGTALFSEILEHYLYAA